MGRNEDGMYLQTIETVDSKRLEFPQEPYAKAGTSPRRNLAPRKRFHTLLTTCQITLKERLEPNDDGLGRGIA